jgi:hypothetical protein
MKQLQYGWQACSKCGGLFYTDRKPVPTCKKGGQHATAGNTNRGVVWLLEKPGVGAGEEVTEEMFWHFCRNCHGLFHVRGDAEASDYGKCNHAPQPGTDHMIEGDMYIVQFIEGYPVGADRRTAYFKCSKCAAMYHPWSSGTACNAGGEHTPFGEKYYFLSAK